MSMGFSDDEVTDASTMRGQDWPCLRQFCIFLENRVGRLSDLLRHIEKDDLRVVALSIVDSVDCAIARVLLDNFDRGRELFNLSEFTVIESDIIGVQLSDHPQPYVQICTALLQAELNIHYTYPLLYRPKGRKAIALYVDDIDAGLKILQQNGLDIVTEGDLMDEEFY